MPSGLSAPTGRANVAAMSDDLLEARIGPVLHLTLNRPERRNALSTELRARLVERLDAAAADDEVAVVVLSGAGDMFCAGFDLKELEAAEDPLALFADSATYHRAVEEFPKPLVAAVHGRAVAGGFDLALMCDMRVATTDSAFGQTQVRQGIPALFELVAKVIGDPAARDLCLTGRLVDAAEAKDLGIVQRLVEPATHFVEETMALAADIAGGPRPSRSEGPVPGGRRVASVPGAGQASPLSIRFQ